MMTSCPEVIRTPLLSATHQLVVSVYHLFCCLAIMAVTPLLTNAA
jgi:hypothetical protein